MKAIANDEHGSPAIDLTAHTDAREVFAVEMTTAVGTCASCGAAGPIDAVHVYRGAGIVLRCPHCDNVLAKIVKSDSRVWIDSTGIRTLEVSV